MGDLVHWQVASWRTISALRHAFLGRTGGVSAGAFASLNLSDRVGDDADAVGENRRRLRPLLGSMRLVLPVQTHASEVRIVTAEAGEAGEADALVVHDANVAIGVLTADCVPVALVAPRRHVAAIVHAGWRGTAMGIAGRTVERLQSECGVPPEEIRAGIGPAIGACCYEVCEEVVDAIRDGIGAMPDGSVRRDAGRLRVDLRRLNAEILRRAGVPDEEIAVVGPCTACATATCFSHRRSRGATGRQISFIGWTA